MEKLFTENYLNQIDTIENWWDNYSLPFTSMVTTEGDEGYHNHSFFEIF